MPTVTRAATRGSQAWMQRAVSSRFSGLETEIVRAVGGPRDQVVWKSPLAPNYKEARDGRVFQQLGVTPTKRPLSDFWPARGPVWDALAVVGNQYVLIEAKAHIPELISGATKATRASLDKIKTALRRTQRSLAPRSKGDWAMSPFFQYANRLAFLQFLREDNGIPAHLVFIYFTNDQDIGGPATREEWQGALRLMEANLGLGDHRLSPFVHKLFVDCRSIGTSAA